MEEGDTASSGEGTEVAEEGGAESDAIGREAAHEEEMEEVEEGKRVSEGWRRHAGAGVEVQRRSSLQEGLVSSEDFTVSCLCAISIGQSPAGLVSSSLGPSPPSGS